MYTYKLWDKKSPINGVSAEDILKRHNITESSVGLVIDESGRVCMFQYDNVNPFSDEAALSDVKSRAYEANNPPEPQMTTEDKVEKFEKDIYAQSFMVAKFMGLEVDMPIEQQAELSTVAVANMPIIGMIDNSEWKPGMNVISGQVVTYEGEEYKCIISHVTQMDWLPNNVPALWKKNKSDISNWVAPTGAHNAYGMGDKIIYYGKIYESLINGNVWSPDDYPAGWKQLD